MSHKKTRRALGQSLKAYTTSVSAPSAQPIAQPVVVSFENGHAETSRHIKVSTRKGSKCHVAMAHESERLSRPAVRIIEAYEAHTMKRYARGEETLRAYRQYPSERKYTFMRYIHDYARKDKLNTRQILDEAVIWYKQHGHERKQVSRKHWGIVGTYDNPILRTA